MNEKSIETAIAYIHGRIQKEIEQISLQTGVPLQYLNTRLGELLHPSGGDWSQSNMPKLRGRPRGLLGSPMEEMEMAGGSPSNHSRSVQEASHAQVHPYKKRGVKSRKFASGKKIGRPKKSYQKHWWDSLSDEEKKAVIAKRVAATRVTRALKKKEAAA